MYAGKFYLTFVIWWFFFLQKNLLGIPSEYQTVWIQTRPDLLFILMWVVMLSCFLFVDALWSPAGKGLTSWLSFVVSYCEIVTFPLVSWVRCGAWLYRFLIFALFLTWKTLLQQGISEPVFYNYGDLENGWKAFFPESIKTTYNMDILPGYSWQL